ncbi:MAG: AmmeMemoRadiSam system protein B [Micrococcales bacterium]|nr:AmmeMemoRadiSam system protein B [Micrococcales bacterium]
MIASVRPPAVAGSFYPADPDVLRDQVDQFLAQAPAPAPGAARPGALIVPHAGYVYSGSTAALAYRLVAGACVDKVVLVGPTHRVAVRGVALPTVHAFATPLGTMRVWPGAQNALADVPWVVVHAATHRDEHAVEVQLPFLQQVLGDVDIVPLNAGAATADQVADVIEALWDSPDTLVVISSDLSHYLPYDEARTRDEATLAQVMALDGQLDHQQACGATPVNGMLEVARRRGLVPRLLGACSSGDTAGDRARVVGYCAVAFDGDGS